MTSNDPEIRIVSVSFDGVVYENMLTGQRWLISGVCSGCGECEVGAVNEHYIVWTGKPIGQPGACYDKRGGPEIRGDYPIKPEAQNDWPSCTLRGRYL
jgi:hypothetical protein